LVLLERVKVSPRKTIKSRKNLGRLIVLNMDIKCPIKKERPGNYENRLAASRPE
jgi:hypothetical protein